MRWLLLCATVLSWVVCVTRHSAGAFGFWLLLGIVGAIATTLGFAQARISANAGRRRNRRGNILHRPECCTAALSV